jgi:methylenetetrahydrofolate reductase (NADPH)
VPGSAVARLLRNYSLEVLPRDRAALAACREFLPAGSRIYIASAPGETNLRIVEMAGALARAGFVPVPHIVARKLAGFRALDDFLARLRGDAGVTSALVLGGDVSEPEGSFRSADQLLETGLFLRHGFKRVGFATYPEAHARIPAAALDAALAGKLHLARTQSLDAWLVTQFCFEASPILAHIRRLRAHGVAVPVHVGAAGPASRKALLRYAMLCGVGASLRALGTQSDRLGHLLLRHTPDTVLAALAPAVLSEPMLGVEGLHLFTFGGVGETARWVDDILRESAAP